MAWWCSSYTWAVDDRSKGTESIQDTNDSCPQRAKIISPRFFASNPRLCQKFNAPATPALFFRTVPTLKMPCVRRHSWSMGEVKKLSMATCTPVCSSCGPNLSQAFRRTYRTIRVVRPRGQLAQSLRWQSPSKPASTTLTKQYPVRQHTAHTLIPARRARVAHRHFGLYCVTHFLLCQQALSANFRGMFSKIMSTRPYTAFSRGRWHAQVLASLCPAQTCGAHTDPALNRVWRLNRSGVVWNCLLHKHAVFMRTQLF